ncbi:SMI1/KNR4 family protein [Verrucomicrobiota bacterium sgz303538]
MRLSDIFAAGFLILIGAAILWGMYTRQARRDSKPRSGTAVPSMTNEDIQKIEQSLGVRLPSACATFLKSPRPLEIDEVTVLADPALVIQRTQQYRTGFGGAAPWSPEFVCLGDESDACPYALDCSSGLIVQTDHGSLNRKPLARYSSFAEFIAEKCINDTEPA